ncbi:branched-subunit amino acid transport protein [Caldalkalibacillus uzonensis]|uniref:Branched-subunit amino acid transport protein n=1 Tax=Caldalkalibacillus uzonensis TaxID=353224 RepID=A0ABU0CT43_9BACI|nr:AzlD domain-containing protein [Caldalkalibacillus uzonensis]MDQ0339595.1 branched-subunit amino acid transport protein [Caldalkalibacillus uzonensis]
MDLFLIIIAMGLVTFLPRFLPAVLLDRIRIPEWAGRWLQAIPYAALGALIFPGILAVYDQPLVGLAGGLVAVIVALLRLHIILVISGAILTVFALNWWMGT